jgi:hypothetical protein
MIFILHWRAFHRTIRTKDAAVARLRTQQRLAARAFTKKLARIGRHCFSLGEAANRAHQHRFENEFAHNRFTCGHSKDSPRSPWLWLRNVKVTPPARHPLPLIPASLALRCSKFKLKSGINRAPLAPARRRPDRHFVRISNGTVRKVGPFRANRKSNINVRNHITPPIENGCGPNTLPPDGNASEKMGKTSVWTGEEWGVILPTRTLRNVPT